MNKYLWIRLLIAVGFSILLSSLNVKFGSGLLQSMFTVLGIAFSIAMSLLVSFDLSKIYNKKSKDGIKRSVRQTRNHIIADFCISTIALFLASTENLTGHNYIIYKFITYNIETCAVCVISISFIYEIYNFTRIQKLNEDIADRIMEEEIKLK